MRSACRRRRCGASLPGCCASCRISAPFLSALPPLILAAAVGPDWTMSIWVVGLFVVVEPIMGYAVEPLVYGHSTGPVAGRGHRLGDLLDVAVGADRADPVDAADPVPRRPRPARQAARVPRRHARRPAGADPGRELLPADARRRSRRGARPGRDAAARPRAVELLRRGRGQGAQPRRCRLPARRSRRRPARARPPRLRPR